MSRRLIFPFVRRSLTQAQPATLVMKYERSTRLISRPVLKGERLRSRNSGKSVSASRQSVCSQGRLCAIAAASASLTYGRAIRTMGRPESSKKSFGRALRLKNMSSLP